MRNSGERKAVTGKEVNNDSNWESPVIFTTVGKSGQELET